MWDPPQLFLLCLLPSSARNFSEVFSLAHTPSWGVTPLKVQRWGVYFGTLGGVVIMFLALFLMGSGFFFLCQVTRFESQWCDTLRLYWRDTEVSTGWAWKGLRVCEHFSERSVISTPFTPFFKEDNSVFLLYSCLGIAATLSVLLLHHYPILCFHLMVQHDCSSSSRRFCIISSRKRGHRRLHCLLLSEQLKSWSHYFYLFHSWSRAKSMLKLFIYARFTEIFLLFFLHA